MTPEEKIELAIRRTRSRMLDEFPQNPDVLRMLEYLEYELATVVSPVPQLPGGSDLSARES